MPYLAVMVMHWSRIALPKASAPEMSATFVRLRFLRSSKIFSHAIRSVCGVLKFHFLTGNTACTAPAKLMSGIWFSSASPMSGIVVAVVEPARRASTLSSSMRRIAKVRAWLGSPPSS